MPDPLDGRLYLGYLRRRWRFPAFVLFAALTAATCVTLIQTPRYSAKVRLMIEPPAASDARAATAVSPIYLESLKTYEHLAASSQLFAEAAAKFALRSGADASRPLEDLKRSVLRVSVPRNTKVLEIGVTLPDPAKAHAVALHLAQQAIELARKAGREADQDLTSAASQAAETAGAHFNKAEGAMRKTMQQSPTPVMIDAELTGLAARRAELERMSLSASLSLADLELRARALADAGDGSQELRILQARVESTRVHAERLRHEHATVSAEIASKQKLAADRKADLEMVAAAYKTAQEARDDAERRLRGIQATAGFRTERLTLLDPGFVPEKPSSPNMPLNLFLAASLALIVSLIWLTAQFAMSGLKSEAARPRLSRIAANS
jgi:capsular polysaccharide biosynthesis protein